MAGNPRVANGHRSRALRKWVLTTQDICHICGKPVDKTLNTYIDPKDGKCKKHPMSGEVDHVVPVSKGGDVYARSNAKLAHRTCNLMKSDKTVAVKTVKSLPTSRNWHSTAD